MQLKDYLELKSQSVKEFTDEVRQRIAEDVSEEVLLTRVWRHVEGQRIPRPEDQLVYEELTKGAVTPADWFTLKLRRRHPPDEPVEPVAASG